MNPVVRGLAVYLFILLIFRIMGKRALSEATTFDFVLLLIISEVTQNALIGEDFSITTAAILITTLMGTDLLLALLKRPFKGFENITEGVALIVVEHGKPLKSRMDKAKVDVEDVMSSARSSFGLERMEQIKYAVLEKDGNISIIPYEEYR